MSFDESYTERRVMSDLLVQHDIGSAQQVNSPNYLIGAHQTRIRSDNQKSSNKAIFDKLDLSKYYIEIDGQRYPRESVLTYYEENEYIEQYQDLKIFFKEFIGEPTLNPLISYPGMKTKYPIGILDLRHQLHQILPKKLNYFKNMAPILTMPDCF